MTCFKVAGVVSRTAGHAIREREPSRMDRQITPRRPNRQGARLPRAIADHHGMVYINSGITEYQGLKKARASHITDRREPWLSRYNTVTKAVANAPTIHSRAIADQTNLQ